MGPEWVLGLKPGLILQTLGALHSPMNITIVSLGVVQTLSKCVCERLYIASTVTAVVSH